MKDLLVGFVDAEKDTDLTLDADKFATDIIFQDFVMAPYTKDKELVGGLGVTIDPDLAEHCTKMILASNLLPILTEIPLFNHKRDYCSVETESFANKGGSRYNDTDDKCFGVTLKDKDTQEIVHYGVLPDITKGHTRQNLDRLLKEFACQ